MTKTQFTIPGRIPSKKNSLRRIKRGKRIYTVPSEKHEMWEINSKLHLPNTHIDNITKIIITIYAPDKRSADLTNKAESLMDLMVKGQVIKDDNWFVVPKLSLIFGGVDKNNPRADVTIL